MSPAVVAVAGLVFIVSTTVALIAERVVEQAADVGFTSLAAYRSTLGVGYVLLGLSAFMLLAGVVGQVMRRPERIGVPVLAVLGFSMLSGGTIAQSADGPTRVVASVVIAAGGALVVAALAWCYVQERATILRVLGIAALLAGAGFAAMVIGKQAIAPLPSLALTYRSDSVLIPSLGLWVAGLALCGGAVMRYALVRTIGRLGSGLAAALIAASALYPWAMGVLRSDEAIMQFDPPGGRFAGPVLWAGAGLLGGVGLWALAAAVVVLFRQHRQNVQRWLVVLAIGLGAVLSSRAIGPLSPRVSSYMLLGGIGVVGAAIVWCMANLITSVRGRSESRHRAVQAWAALAVLGGMAVGLALLVLTPPDVMLIAPIDGRPDNQSVLLIAVAALALGELVVVLGVVRYLFTFFTTVSIAGVTIGSMALVIVLSVMSGFESDLRNKILGSNAHLLITKDEGTFTEYRDIAARVADVPGVVATTPYLTSEVVIAANNNYSNVIIKGVDPATVGEVTELDENSETPRALERLWPLADDGGVAGPPGDAGPDDGADGGQGEADAGSGDGEPEDGTDPPPSDLDVDIGEPTDFSGGEPGADEGGDPPPPDLRVDIGEPTDFSGGEPGPGDEPLVAHTDGGDAGVEEHIETGDADVLVAPFQPERESAIANLDQGRPRIPPRIARLPGVLVGRELAKQIHLYVGQEVRIVSPLAEDTPAGPVPRTRFLRVADVFYSGMYEYDFKFVYVPLPVLQAFLDLGDQVTGIEIRVTDPDDTGPVTHAIRERLAGSYRVQDWKELNRSLFSALKLEKIAMFLVLAIIILVASFSIIGNLIMVVVEKAREIALLKTLGASNAGIMQIFVAQGFFIGLVGTTLGVVHGLIACALGLVYGLPIDPEVYYIDRLPIHVETEAVMAVALAGIVISVVATLYPAYVGARMQPIEGLRYE